MQDFTIKEIKENIAALKEAYKRSLASGGVTSYTINSGQGSTTVQQASLSSIRSELAYFRNMLNERLEYESGSHCVYLRDSGGM